MVLQVYATPGLGWGCGRQRAHRVLSSAESSGHPDRLVYDQVQQGAPVWVAGTETHRDSATPWSVRFRLAAPGCPCAPELLAVCRIYFLYRPASIPRVWR